MLGTKFIKGEFTEEEYSACAEWCNETQEGHIEDKGDYYEVVENVPIEPLPIDNEPTQLDRIEAQVMYTALLTDTLIESEVE